MTALHLRDVVLVIHTITESITEQTQSAFVCVGHGLFLRLFQCKVSRSRCATVSDIFVETAVANGDAHNHGKADSDGGS